MACAFASVSHSGFTAVYRTAIPRAPAEAHFIAFGLAPPSSTRAVRAHSWLIDWLQLDLVAFLAFFRSQPPKTVVYTRSIRVSWASVICGLTTFIELHDPLTPLRIAWLRYLLKTRRLPGLVATTEQLKADLIAALPGLDPTHILVAGNAGPASALAQPATPLPHAGIFNIGYAGSAFPGKGIEIVLACAALQPEVTFHIIGPTIAACTKIGTVPPNVVIHGHLPYPQVIGYLKSMDALLLPNQRSVIIRSGADIGSHTSPLKLFDYLASGRPIVASDLPVFAGILRNEDNALVVAPDQPEAFVTQLRRLRTDPMLAQRLGLCGQKDFAARYTWDQRAKRIYSFMTSTLPS